MNRWDTPVSPEEQEILDAAPRMDPQMRVVIEAWFQLASVRPVIVYTEVVKGQLAVFTRRGEIPWDKVRDWGSAKRLSDESIELLAAVIHILDHERHQQER